jgi:hypothetical protein
MNKREIVTRALRELGVVGYQRSPNGQMYEVGEEKLAQLYADINGPWGGMTLTFGLEELPVSPGSLSARHRCPRSPR